MLKFPSGVKLDDLIRQASVNGASSVGGAINSEGYVFTPPPVKPINSQPPLSVTWHMSPDAERIFLESHHKGMEEKKLTGGFVNYYLVQVDHPQREEQPPYQAECEDIIQALGMDFNEGCIFKALWRSANSRRGNSKPNHKMLYDAEKIVHYAKRNLNRVKQEGT